MTAVPWSADASLEMQDLVSAPTWAILKSIPPQLYSLDGINVIASGIGDPLHTENSRLEPFHLGDTKVKVEIKLENLPPLAVIVRDTQGYSVRVNVEYPRLPPKCCNCGKFGHMLKYCTIPIQRKNFKNNQVLPRVSSAATQVTVVDTNITPEGSNSKGKIEPDSSREDYASNNPEVQMDKYQAPVMEPVSEDCLVSQEGPSASKHPSRTTGFPPFTDKPTLRFLTHRLDRNKKLRIQQCAPSSQEVLLPPNDLPTLPGPLQSKSVSEDAGVELEEEEISFLPSPAAVKKAKKLKRLEAKFSQSSPSQAVSQMFSSIRGNSLGGGPRRF